MSRKPYPLEIPPVGYRAPMKGDKREIHKPSLKTSFGEDDRPQGESLSPSGTDRGKTGRGVKRARQEALDGIRGMLDE